MSSRLVSSNVPSVAEVKASALLGARALTKFATDDALTSDQMRTIARNAVAEIYRTVAEPPQI